MVRSADAFLDRRLALGRESPATQLKLALQYDKN
jgi:hypothetical protein